MKTVPTHPLAPHLALVAIAGVVATVAGIALLATGGSVIGCVSCAAGPVLVAAWWSSRAQLRALQAAGLAVQKLTRGEIPEAEALLDAIPERIARKRVVARVVAIQRAMIAIDRGQPAEAVARTTSALVEPDGRMYGAFDRQQIACARSLRALAHAMQGDLERAEEDAAAANAVAEASPDVLARTRVVRAVVLARRGDDALATHLASSARVVLDHALPRERALFRALLRMTRARKRSVYREPSPAADRDHGRLGAWIARVAPGAAAFVDHDRLDVAPDALPAVPVSTPEAMIAVEAARRRSAGKAGTSLSTTSTIAVWVGLAGALLFSWQAMRAPSARGVDLGALFDVAILATFVLVAALAAARSVRALKQERAVAAARREAIVGDVAKATRALEKLASSAGALVAANARLALAKLAAADAEFTRVMAHCDAGLARVNAQPMRARAADMLLPSLVVESAVANAATGRFAEADAEIAMLCRDFPTYALLAVAQARVRLVRAARARDVDAAAAVARARTPELWLPRQEDFLCDLALAASRSTGVTDDERASLGRELAEDRRLAAWIDAVAPAIRDEALGTRGPYAA
jgi:hypothetical protein